MAAKSYLIHHESTYRTSEIFIQPIKDNACQWTSKNNTDLGLSTTVHSSVSGGTCYDIWSFSFPQPLHYVTKLTSHQQVSWLLRHLKIPWNSRSNRSLSYRAICFQFFSWNSWRLTRWHKRRPKVKCTITAKNILVIVKVP